MSGDDGNDASFDPRRWGAGDRTASSPALSGTSATSSASGGTSARAAIGEASFDPRTWGGAAPPPAAAERPATPPAAPPRPPRGDHPNRPVPLAIASSVAILLAGAGLAWSQRGTVPPPVASQPATEGAGDITAAAGPVAVPAGSAPVANASRRSLVIAGPQELGPTLAASGVGAGEVRAAVGAAAVALGTQPGEVHLEYDLVDGDGGTRTLSRLVATRADGAGVTLTAKPDGSFASEVLQAKLTTTVKVVRGEMDATSFYNAAVNAGITDSLISDFANAFSFDFDFQREVHPGDVFEGAFEQKVNPSGEPVGAPVLVYVSLQTQAKAKSLYRFLAPGDKEAGWYDGNGKSTVKALMRTPVDGARISSQFGYRVHPVLGFMKLHKGTDFAAPIGTPIYASGNGTVEWAAMKGPNGNLTILRHDNGWETYYLHQNMFMPGVAPGARVSQGQKIGEIGTTGRSTGPHLHYEVHIKGEAVDSTKIDTGTGKSLDGSGLAAFKKERDRIDAARAGATG